MDKNLISHHRQLGGKGLNFNPTHKIVKSVHAKNKYKTCKKKLLGVGVKYLLVFIFLFVFSQLLVPLPVQSSLDQTPSAAVVGRYVLYEDKFWIFYNKTVGQLRAEGYDVQGDSNLMLEVHYTYLGYTFKCKILELSFPTVTLGNTEGKHVLKVIAYKNGAEYTSFEREIQPFSHTWQSQNPDLGLMFNPAAFVIGYTFPTTLLEYRVDSTELLNTPWGQNETYVLHGSFSNATHSFRNTVWCDAKSGIILKIVWDSETSTYVSREEMKTIETGVAGSNFEVTYGEDVSETQSVDSTSNVTVFVYDSTTNEISLTVSGSTGTSGEFTMPIPKELVPPEHTFEAYIDDQKTGYELSEDNDNYYIHVEYQHSAHTIRIGFVSVSPFWMQWWLWLVIGTAILVSAGSFYLIRRKHR